MPCGRDIEQPWGWLTIDFLVLGEHETTLHVRMRLAPPPPPGPGVFDSPFLGALTLADDRGTTTEARFSGGGSGIAWSGEYTARHPLAWDAEWIEVLGERIEPATRAGVAAQVRIEPLAEPDPDRRYLRAVLGGMVHYEDAAWRDRLRDGQARPERPALHAALYGRATAALRRWTRQPDLAVEVTMIGEDEPPALTRGPDGLAAELPFGWLVDVWARGLITIWGRFCVGAAPAAGGWTLSTVGPDLGPPAPVSVGRPPES